jgi:hypothetical protein
MKRLTRDEEFLIAVNLAKLPSVPRQILKDIPRPPIGQPRRLSASVNGPALLSYPGYWAQLDATAMPGDGDGAWWTSWN